MNLRKTGLAVTAALAATAVAAPAASAYTAIGIYDGVPTAANSGNSINVYNTDVAATVQVLRGGVVVGTARPDFEWWSEFDVAAGDVVQVLNANTKAVIAETTYNGRPALVTCGGSTTFTGTRNGTAEIADVSAYPEVVTDRYSDSEYVYGDLTAQGDGTFAGTWSRALPADYLVSTTEVRKTGEFNDPNTVMVTTFVERRASQLCPPAPAVPAAPVAAPVTPTVPATIVTPKEIAKRLLQTTIQNLVKGGVAGVTKPQTVPVTVTSPGTLQIQQFSGAAPKKVVAYAAAAKKKKAAKTAKAPKNLIASGERTFAKAGNGTVKVKPTKRAKAITKGKKRLTVTVRVVFTPKGGKPVATDQKITLKRATK